MKNNIRSSRTARPSALGRWIAVILCLTLLAAVFSGAAPRRAALRTASAQERQEMSAADIYEQNVGSTVGVTTTVTTNVWGYETKGAVAGSGFIVSDDGYILTNYHVVEGAETITITAYDDTTYDAELIGYDESNDIAVLKVDAEGLTPVTIGDSNALRVGDDVIAIGNPLGELTFSLTGGRVSALDREITVSSGVTMDLIQTDCAINAGNSGGALFNMYGEVVGITNAKYSSRGSSSEASIDNIGFAIPISRVFSVVESIMTDGVISKPYIGVSVSPVSQEALNYGLPKGAAVKEVNEDSPAEEAGLQVNDIITQANGAAITTSGDLVDVVGAAQPGDELVLTVYRQGETVEITVEVGENVKPALPEETEPEETPAPQTEQFPLDSFEDFMRQFGGGYFN